MLNVSEVAYCKKALGEIRSGEKDGNTDFVFYIELLLDTIRSIRTDSKGTYCDWLQWNSEERRNEIEEKLEEMHDCIRCHQSPLGKMRWSSWNTKEILDHHFWNDCDAFWCHKGKGRYGTTPGEDVLIKLYYFAATGCC